MVSFIESFCPLAYFSLTPHKIFDLSFSGALTSVASTTTRNPVDPKDNADYPIDCRHIIHRAGCRWHGGYVAQSALTKTLDFNSRSSFHTGGLLTRKAVHDERKDCPNKQYYVAEQTELTKPERTMLDIVAAS